MLNDPLLIENLEVRYGSTHAVKGVSFSIEPGEVFSLLGPNGAGKTSIISSIMTLVQPTNGAIRIFGTDVSHRPTWTKQQVGFVPQELIHHGYFSLEKILQFHSSYYGLEDNQKQIDFLLKKLDLWDQRHKLVSQLSGGMKRRVLIAKALVHKPRLILLDEPTAGVDIDLKYSLWEFIKELREEGCSILLTTHYLEEAELLSDRIGILRLGSLIKVGHLHSLLEEHSSRLLTLTIDNEEFQSTHPWFEKQVENKHIFKIPRSKNLQEILKELKCPIDLIQDINIREGRLEDAFLEVLHEA